MANPTRVHSVISTTDTIASLPLVCHGTGRADRAQHAVEDTDALVEHQQPDQRGDQSADHDRQVDDRAEDLARASPC